MNSSHKISCPKCGNVFDVETALAGPLEERLRSENQKIISGLENQFQEKNKALQQKLTDIAKKEAELENQVIERTNAEVAQKIATKTKEITQSLNERYLQEIKSLKDNDNKLREENAKLRESEIEKEKLKRQLAEQRQNIELEYEKKKTKEFNEYAEKIKRLEEERLNQIIRENEEKSTLKLKEYEVQLDQQKKLIEEMKRKSEQGSMQLQGEVLEITIEEVLNSLFPFDTIAEVPKGVKGADVQQTVKTKFGADAGIILYESKRTKAFNNEWIGKLKADAVSVKADVCVIVTDTMPDNIETVGQKEGVWICNFSTFKPLVIVLRDSILRVNEAFSSQANKGDKMQMLYDYLISQEFRLQIGAIIEGFIELQNGYVQEKNAMEKIWKRREKQLEKVLLNTNHFIGSIQGIAGNSIEGINKIGPKTDENLLDF